MGHTLTANGHKTGHSNGCGCGTCTIAPFTRNNYFTGKLLLERDFTDEQQYVRDKIRHHNQRLHGIGVVCGLEVVQHPNEDCRTRFVRLTPGTAIDCCGNEILVVDEEDIELATLPGITELDPDDDAFHEVQICLRFKECGNEPVPVLYDECGCDDDRCLPNRILESFEVAAVVDPPATGPTWTGPPLVRGVDLPFPEATLVTVLPDGRLLVGEGTTVHLVDPGGGTVSRDLGSDVLGLDPAPGGSFYATRDDGGALVVSVLDDALATTHDENVADSSSPVTTAVTADGRLLLLQPGTGTITVYADDLEGGSPAAPVTVTVDKDRGLLAVHPTEPTAYVAADAASPDPAPTRIDVVDLDAGTGDEFARITSGRVTALAASEDLLVVTVDDKTAVGLAHSDGAVAGEATLAGSAVDLTSGDWAYAVAASGGQSLVQPLGVDRMAAGRPDAAGPALGFAGDARAVAAGAEAVYVAYAGTGGEPGGVAVFEVLTTSCRVAWDELKDCPHCESPDCVVVATLHGYRPGFAVLDADPTADPEADRTAGVARIDNHTRTRLRSTAVLEAAIECLFDGGTTGGGTGPQGPPGPPGRDGQDGRDGRDGQDGQDGRDGQDGQDGAPGQDGRPGRDGRDGEGLEQGLTQIDLLSWRHRERLDLNQRIVVDADGNRRLGVVISFTREVDASLIDADHVFTVDAPRPPEDNRFGDLYRCRCPLSGTVEPVQVLNVSNGVIDAAEVTPGTQFATAVAFIFPEMVQELIQMFDGTADFWVRLQGEFVVDVDRRAVDAEFTRAELPTGDRPAGSEFGVQGGLFQSWFVPALG
jgi:collagen triple helix repeat protein